MENSLPLINAKSLLIEGITKESQQFTNALPHQQLLETFIEYVEEADFIAEVYPTVIELREKLTQLETNSPEAEKVREEISKYKLNLKEILVLVIEHILKLAESNNWGLCKNNNAIYLYNSEFWLELEPDKLKKFLGESSMKLGIQELVAKHYHFREELLKQFLSAAYLPTPQQNNEMVLINLKNGTYKIEANSDKLILKSFNPDDFLTYQLPFEYNEEATASIFQNYLNRVLPDLSSQQVLAEYIGFVFIKQGNTALKLEKALILYGSGANGKSVFFEVVNALLGTENTCNYSLQNLTDEKGYQRAKLANKLVNYASEINGKLEASIFKQLVSGEPVEARLPYGQPFNLTQYAKLIFNCNELPTEVEQTNAFFRRFLIVPFTETIPPEEQDRNLHTKIINNELSGVFNWVLAGLKRLLNQKGFTHCEAADLALNKYKTESDSVLMFLSENDYKADTNSSTSLKGLFNDYKNYCLDSGFKYCSLKTFRQRLESNNFVVRRISQGMVVNIKSTVQF